MAKKINRDYFFQDETRTIYYMDAVSRKIGTPDHSTGLVYMGTSDNPNPKMAAAVFIQQGKALTGCKIRKYSE